MVSTHNQHQAMHGIRRHRTTIAALTAAVCAVILCVTDHSCAIAAPNTTSSAPQTRTAEPLPASDATSPSNTVSPLASVPSKPVSTAFTASPDTGIESGNTPVEITAPSRYTFTQVSTGTTASVALSADKTIYAWGSNVNAHVGPGSSAKVADPKPVPATNTDGTPVTFSQVSTGTNHTLALSTDGTIWAWGSNSRGQLSNGKIAGKITAPTPITISGSTAPFTKVSTGMRHSLALSSNGLIYAWGDNARGEVGDGSKTSQISTPTIVSPFDPDANVHTRLSFIDIAAGDDYTLAIDVHGNLWTWGDNKNGTLGNGTKTGTATTPTRILVPGVTFKTVQAGDNHALALSNDGRAWEWGTGADNQFTPTPLAMPNGVTFTSISAGAKHSMAMSSDGNVYVWGSNIDGQLGNGTKSTTPSPSPTPVTALTGQHIATISAGGNTSMALDRDGNLWAWGDNTNLQTGAGKLDGTTMLTDPAKTSDTFYHIILTSVTFGSTPGKGLAYDSAAGRWRVTTPAHAPGTVTMTINWTFNGAAQTPTTVPFTFTRVAMAAPLTVTFDTDGGSEPPASQQVSGGMRATMPATPTKGNHAFAGWYDGDTLYDFSRPVTTSLTLRAHWHQYTISPDSGPSTGKTTVSLTPVNGRSYVQLSAGYTHTLGLDTSGTIWAWGHNQNGAVGDGTTTVALSPVRAAAPAGVRFTQISAGNDFSMALDTDGHIWTWGYNSNGQLGDSTTTTRTAPTCLNITKDGIAVAFNSISAGQSFALAVSTNGDVWSWGQGSSGQLGNGTLDDNTTPHLVNTGNLFSSVAAGSTFSLALSTSGTIYSWGNNASGQLGDSTTDSRAVPAAVTSPDHARFTAISAGYIHALALSSSGTIYAAGNNTYGQLGLGTTGNTSTSAFTSTFTAVKAPDSAIFTAISAGQYHSLALSATGNAYSWGKNAGAELGNGKQGGNVTAPAAAATGKPDTTYAGISAGENHSIARSKDGAQYSWGQNYSGQLGVGRNANGSVTAGYLAPTRNQQTAQAHVTSIQFGGTNGTDLAHASSSDYASSWTVTTPSHTAGTYPVTINWELDGVAQPAQTLQFTFIAPPVPPQSRLPFTGDSAPVFAGPIVAVLLVSTALGLHELRVRRRP